MIQRNIKPLTFYLQHDSIIFPNKEDPHIPKQIAEELSVRNDVVEVVKFPPSGKLLYRVSLKHGHDFYACIFYSKCVIVFSCSIEFFSYFTKSTSKKSILIIPLNNETLMLTVQALKNYFSTILKAKGGHGSFVTLQHYRDLK